MSATYVILWYHYDVRKCLWLRTEESPNFWYTSIKFKGICRIAKKSRFMQCHHNSHMSGRTSILYLPYIADCKRARIPRTCRPIFQTFVYFSSKWPIIDLITSQLDCPSSQQHADMCWSPWFLLVEKLSLISVFLTSHHTHHTTHHGTCLSSARMLCYAC